VLDFLLLLSVLLHLVGLIFRSRADVCVVITTVVFQLQCVNINLVRYSS
jgi:hypothetical protein